MADETANSAGQADTKPRIRRQVKVGRVVSDKMDKTVVVAVENTTTHRLYHRYMKRTSKFHAHDEDNRCKVGDQVEIVSSRPLSKTKRWRVREILKRAE
jgi:small subunit ribosomal protein S17